MKEFPPSTLTTEDTSNWSHPLDGDLGCSPFLDLQLEYFLEGEMPLLRAEDGDGFWWELMPKPYLVARIVHSPWREGCGGICTKGMGLI